MRELGFKREIETVCEIWKGGLVGYLTWKLSKVLGLDDEIVKVGVEEDHILFDEIRGEDGITTDKCLSERDSRIQDKDSEIVETDLFLMRNEMQDLALMKSMAAEEDILALIDDEDKENHNFEDFGREDILDLENRNLDYMDIDMIRDF